MTRCPKCNCENVLGTIYCERCGTILPNSDAHPFTDPTYNSSYEVHPSAPTYANTYEASPSAPTYANTYEANASALTEQGLPPSIPPPPPPPAVPYTPNIHAVPSSGYAAPSGRAHKRSIGGTILSSILYLLGIFCFALGSVNLQPGAATNANLGIIFIGIFIIGLIVLILLLNLRKYLYLTWWMRILIVAGLTCLAIVVLTFYTMVHVIYPYKGLLFIIYGFLTAVVALW